MQLKGTTTDNRTSRIITSLIQIAWADREMTEAEMRMLGYILEKMGQGEGPVTGLERGPADLGPPPALEDVLQDVDDRQEVMRYLVALAFCDGHCSLDEFIYIEKMAARLELSQADVTRLRDQAMELLMTGPA